MLDRLLELYPPLVRLCTLAVGIGSAVAATNAGIDNRGQPIAAGVLALASAVALGVLVLDSKEK
jgi:hypothetical protein